MSFTHYPKNSDNLVMAWVQPAPPDVILDEEGPDFLGRPYSEMNLLSAPIDAGASVVGYHDAQPFTRFYGTIACDQPLEVTITFSNEDVDAAGRIVSDNNVGELHYDGEALKLHYDPQKQGATGKFFTMIYGRWIRAEIKNLGEEKPLILRVYIRGSVF